jgi:hypothetical protein
MMKPILRPLLVMYINIVENGGSIILMFVQPETMFLSIYHALERLKLIVDVHVLYVIKES